MRRALDEISRLTSSFARLDGYGTLLYEMDEPSTADVARLLRHAAANLAADADMHELLLEVADLSLDQRSLVDPILAAAATGCRSRSSCGRERATRRGPRAG